MTASGETGLALFEPIARRPRLAALLGALIIAFSGIFYRFALVTPATVTVFRCLYGLPILFFVAWLERRRYGPLPGHAIRFSILAGIFFAGDLLSWHHSVDNVGAGLATVLGNLQVLVVPLVAWVVIRERPPRAALLALPVVLAGALLISGVIGGVPYGTNPPLGVALGSFTAFAYSGYLLLIRRGGRDVRRPAGPVAISTVATMTVAIVFGVISGELDPIPHFPSHLWLIALGITSQSIGYLIISISLPRLPASLVSIILMVQPVATIVLAFFLLGEDPSPGQLLGVGLIMAGVAFATVPVARLRDRLRSASVSEGVS
ncbi:MAG TPA: DMT family transporter [Candidatus Limnocylindrales bacterium]